MLAIFFSTLPRYSLRPYSCVICHSTSHAKNESISSNFPFLLTQLQRESPARANNKLRRPPSEPDKLKKRINGLPKDIIRRHTEWNRQQSSKKVAPQSRASYLHSHGLLKRTRARVFSPKHSRMGTAGSVRFHDLTQQGDGKWKTHTKVFAQTLAHGDSKNDSTPAT